LAFFGFSPVRNHFWPFTGVVREIRRKVTRKVGKIADDPAFAFELRSAGSQSLAAPMTNSQHVYEVRPRRDKRGFDLISDALPLGRLWYDGTNAISYAKYRSRSHDAVIRVYDEAGNMIDTHEHKSDCKDW
jgi:hypothetical protein